MKITTGGLEHYQSYLKTVKNSENAQKGPGKVGAGTAAKTDKVTISGEAAAKAELGRMTAAMSAEVEQMAGAERVDALRTAVQAGEYYVASEDLADAILAAEA